MKKLRRLGRRKENYKIYCTVEKLADSPAFEAGAVKRVGSSPTCTTN